MNEMSRTMAHAGIALALLALALLSRPAMPRAAAYEDQGRPFYPEFTDPTAAASLEVTDWDDAGARARNFKVELKDGRYVIPSKSNHPADAKDRLSKTAAAMIGLRKEDVRSDNPKDHELYGVVDPGEPATGKGARVTMRDAGGKVLTDLIFGKSVKEKPCVRYVRAPGQRRVYESKVPYEVSAKFSDWVETDLLQISTSQLKKLELNSYTVDEEAGMVKDMDVQTLVKETTDWRLESLAPGEELKKEAVEELTSALDDLKIVDVRRKPDNLAKLFRHESERVTRMDLGDLQDRGFYAQQGRIYANEGELTVRVDDGVVYQLWFGEIVSDADDGKELGKESRYLLIRTAFNEDQFPAIPAPKETKEDGTPKPDDEKKKDQEDYEGKKKDRDAKLEAGKKREQALAKRFGDWYYVIPADGFKKLRKTKAELTKKPEEKKPEESKPGEEKPK